METVILVVLFVIRALCIWQLGEIVHNIEDKKLKGLALCGMLIYVGYLIYGVITSAIVNPLAIISLTGFFLVLLAINKYFKKLKGKC